MTHYITPECTRAQREQYGLPLLHEEEAIERTLLVVSEADHAKIGRGAGWIAVVFDHHTERHYRLKSAPCGLGCHCSARLVGEVSEPTTDEAYSAMRRRVIRHANKERQ